MTNFFFEFEKWHAIRASLVDMGGVLVWVGWVACLRGTRSWVAHFFSYSFQKLAGKGYCSKLEKEFRFQVIYTFHGHFLFKSLPGIFEFKVMLIKQIQNFILRTLWKCSILMIQLFGNESTVWQLTIIHYTTSLQ